MRDHPLFPSAGEDVDVSSIHVTRVEPGQGTVFAPRLFDAEELTTLDELATMFGGGAYELIGRSDTKRISARQRYNLPGPPIPLQGAPPPAPAAPPAAASSGASHGDTPFMLQFVMQMMQMQAQAQTQQTQFMMTMLNSSKSDSQAMVQAMGELARAQTASMGEFFKASIAQQGNGGDAETLLQGMELARAMAPADTTSDVGAIVQGVVAMAANRQSTPPAPMPPLEAKTG